LSAEILRPVHEIPLVIGTFQESVCARKLPEVVKDLLQDLKAPLKEGAAAGIEEFRTEASYMDLSVSISPVCVASQSFKFISEVAPPFKRAER